MQRKVQSLMGEVKDQPYFPDSFACSILTIHPRVTTVAKPEPGGYDLNLINTSLPPLTSTIVISLVRFETYARYASALVTLWNSRRESKMVQHVVVCNVKRILQVAGYGTSSW